MHQLRLVVYPIIYKVVYIPGGVGFLPSTVSIKGIFSQGKYTCGESRWLATPKFDGEFGHDKPRLMGVAPSTFQVVYLKFDFCDTEKTHVNMVNM